MCSVFSASVCFCIIKEEIVPCQEYFMDIKNFDNEQLDARIKILYERGKRKTLFHKWFNISTLQEHSPLILSNKPMVNASANTLAL